MPIPTSPARPREARLFRNNRSQAVRIPVGFELPGDRVLIYREGDKLIIDPVRTPANIIELLAAWRQEPTPGPDNQFPDIEDPPVQPADLL